MKVRIAQIGARKGYAAVSALARHQALESLCTDIYYRGATMRGLAAVCDILGATRYAVTLRSRRCAGVPDKLVRTCPLVGVLNQRRVRHAIARGMSHVAYCQGGRAFATAVSRLPWKHVDAFYGFSSACLEAFQAAKTHGVTCILDHETAPALLESALVQSAEELFEEWLPYKRRAVTPGLTAYAKRQQAEAELADRIICPSSFAANLVRSQGIDDDRVACVPFAMGEAFDSSFSEHPGPLRVLFAGNDAIRKGLPVLVAALKLMPQGAVEARSAGNWTLSDYGWNQCRRVMQVLGPIPRSEMARHYQWADVFVLPTFSDTMGVVILEAMASGVPVIATETSGGPDLIRPGLDGFVIPVNSPEALAERLIGISEDRQILNAMSRNAYASSRQYALEKYGDRLLTEIAIPGTRSNVNGS